jgi:hypothetical protein
VTPPGATVHPQVLIDEDLAANSARLGEILRRDLSELAKKSDRVTFVRGKVRHTPPVAEGTGCTMEPSRQADRRADGRADGRTDGQTDGWKAEQRCRRARA